MNKSCVAACLESVRMAVESVSGSAWNHCPDVRGMGVRVSVESAILDEQLPAHKYCDSGSFAKGMPNPLAQT